jgi:hypothetical protein
LTPEILARFSIRNSISRLINGSPPVNRSFSTPSPIEISAMRMISS